MSNGKKFCLKPFTLLNVIESSNGSSRNTLAKNSVFLINSSQF